MSNYKLRPHHGLCIQFYKGKGYSKEFVLHMNHLLKEFQKNPNIMIISQTDILCEKCPNNIEEVCITQDKVKEIDKVVAELCFLKEKQIISFVELIEIVKNNIIKVGKMKAICKDCQWAYICIKNIDE